MSILRDLSLYMSTYNFSFNQVVIINMISDLKHFQGRDDLKLDECLCAPLNANFCQSGRSFHLVLDLQFPFIFPSQIFLLSLQWLPLKVEAVWAPFETKKKKRMPHLPCKCSNTSTAIIEIALLCRSYVLWPIFDGEQDSKPVTCLSFSSHRLFLSYSAYWFVLVLHYLVFAQLSNC